MKTIVFDIDGVLLDLHSALEKEVQKVSPNFSMSRVLTYDFNKSLDISKAPQWFLDSMEYTEVGKVQYGLNADRGYIFKLLGDINLFKNSSLFYGVIDGIISLSRHYDIVFHSLSYGVDIGNYKAELLDNLFKGKFDYTIINSIGSVKPCIMGADFVVEDNILDLRGYLKSNTELLLVDKPYNTDKYNNGLKYILDNCKRFDNINKVFDYLLSIV